MVLRYLAHDRCNLTSFSSRTYGATSSNLQHMILNFSTIRIIFNLNDFHFFLGNLVLVQDILGHVAKGTVGLGHDKNRELLDQRINTSCGSHSKKERKNFKLGQRNNSKSQFLLFNHFPPNQLFDIASKKLAAFCTGLLLRFLCFTLLTLFSL